MRFAVLAALCAVLNLPVNAQEGARAAASTLDAAAGAAANEAAARFLVLLDEGRVADTWTQGAVLLRGAVPQDQWSGVISSMRAPLGAMKSRRLLSSTHTRSLPGAPDGDYVVVQYQTEFANKAAAVETVTPMREPDGSWKVAGYFLK